MSQCPLLCHTQGIRIIKLFAWEKDFMSKIDKTRRNEMRSLRSYMVSALCWLALLLSIVVRNFLLCDSPEARRPERQTKLYTYILLCVFF